jgi:hypothetical protein
VRDAVVVVRLEGFLFALGAALRILLLWTFNPSHGYDAQTHFDYAKYIAEHGALPPLMSSFVAYHPPMFYLLMAPVVRLGGSIAAVQVLGVAMGIARLALVWHGLRRALPADDRARSIGLALAAVLPVSIHLDAMVSNESLNALLATAILVLLPRFLGDEAPKHGVVLALSTLLAAELATKASAVVSLGVVLLAAAVRFARPPVSMSRVRAASPLAAAAVVAVIAAVPAYAPRSPGDPWIATSWDTVPKQRQAAQKIADVPLWLRRSPSYVLGVGDAAMLSSPFFPNDSGAEPRFWPVLLATTFGDYYAYSYAGPARPGEKTETHNHGRVGVEAVRFAAASFCAGIVIALVTFAGLVATCVVCWRRRDVRAVVLAAPIGAVLLQLQFAWTFPFDDQGMIKAHYVQLGVAPLFAVFGIAVSWCWRARRTQPLAVISLAAVVVVAAYSIWARCHAL